MVKTLIGRPKKWQIKQTQQQRVKTKFQANIQHLLWAAIKSLTNCDVDRQCKYISKS